ncbi:MAG: endonuclease/exonuclease/phosphatase family protein, partial [Flavobacteriaceae bacterium]
DMKASQRPKKIFCSKRVKKINSMKGLSFFNKIVFTINCLFAIILLLACLCPFVSVATLPFLPFLGLSVPFLVGVNLFFVLFWALKWKRQVRLSLITLIIGYLTLGTFIRFGAKEKVKEADDLTILSYNVRSFNVNKNIQSETVFEDIKAFVDREKPDVVCFQETGYLRRMEYTEYPYKHLEYINNPHKVLVGIFSKYPIVNAELLNFPNTRNNATYADIAYQNDTIRIYNLHLQSLGITPGSGIIKGSSTEKLYAQLTKSFQKQEEQANFILEHRNTTDRKTLICGDFNNNQYSRAYHLLKGEKLDSFNEMGQGYGRTYLFHGMPVRIDFILADSDFEVVSHKNFDIQFSDHYPVLASFRLK